MKQLRLLFPVLFIFFMLPLVSGQNLAKDAMVAYWNFSPKAEVKAEKIENFLLNDYVPAMEKNYPGVNFFLLKNDRGNNEGGYSLLAIFKSMEARNEWWPEQGKSSEKAEAAAEKMKELIDIFNSMLKMDSWNDWLVL